MFTTYIPQTGIYKTVITCYSYLIIKLACFFVIVVGILNSNQSLPDWHIYAINDSNQMKNTAELFKNL